MDLIGHLIGPLVPELETTPTRELHRHPERSLPQPAGTVRADTEVKTRAGCE